MYYQCDLCGYEVHNVAMRPARCEVCGLGTMCVGRGTRGFAVRDGAPVPRNLPVPGYEPTWTGQEDKPEKFNYFAGDAGKRYQEFVQERTVYIGHFTKIMVPEPERFAWLVPYTGNAHNRTHFTQLVLATVAQAKFIDNGGKFPRLIEPFLGSGQVFLHASTWGPAFNNGLPLFHQVIGGDLNGYLIAAFTALDMDRHNAVNAYISCAERWDNAYEESHALFTNELDKYGRVAVTQPRTKEARDAAFRYIWLVNRCLRGTKINNLGGVAASLNPDLKSQLHLVRRRERNSLTAICEVLGKISFTASCQDFAATCSTATANDIVFMDCPFPKFTRLIPPTTTSDKDLPAYFGETANTYGTDSDGSLQSRIIAESRRLVQKGTTVILCNFANPGLVVAYSRLVAAVVGDHNLRHYTYTYRSPSTTSEAYQLTVIPGKRDIVVPTVPDTIRHNWVAVGGDDNFTVDRQEFFRPAGLDGMEVDDQDDDADTGQQDDEDDSEWLPDD
jgi:site-specific DNA-adenine methylase